MRLCKKTGRVRQMKKISRPPEHYDGMFDVTRMRILHISDLHIDTPTAKQSNGELSDSSCLQKLSETIRNQFFDIAVITGDIMNDIRDPVCYSYFQNWLGSYWESKDSNQAVQRGTDINKVRLITIPGESDKTKEKDSFNKYRELFSKYDLSSSKRRQVTVKSDLILDFHYLDTTSLGSKKYGYYSQGKSADLANLPKSHFNIVVMHHSPIKPSNFKRKPELEIKNNHSLLPLLAQANVHMILCGHWHKRWYWPVPLFLMSNLKRRGQRRKLEIKRLRNKIAFDIANKNKNSRLKSGKYVKNLDLHYWYYLKLHWETIMQDLDMPNADPIKEFSSFTTASELHDYISEFIPYIKKTIKKESSRTAFVSMARSPTISTRKKGFDIIELVFGKKEKTSKYKLLHMKFEDYWIDAKLNKVFPQQCWFAESPDYEHFFGENRGERIERILEHNAHNTDVLFRLKEALKSKKLYPFIGAGLSIPCDYPGWSDFLLNISSQTGIKDEIRHFIERGDFESAAEIARKSLSGAANDDVFYRRIRSTFGRYSLNDKPGMPRGPIAILPQVWADEPVFTTNFDPLIEETYKRVGKPFIHIPSIYDKEKIESAIDGQRMLIKLHGDSEYMENIILTNDEYAKYYGGIEPENIDFDLPLPKVLKHMFQNKTFLFLGCSLKFDRTVRLLEYVRSSESHRRDHYRRDHYALVESTNNDSLDEKREIELSQIGIYPFFYPHGEHETIQLILEELA